MKKQMLHSEYRRFGSQVLYFIVISLIVVGLTYPAIDLANSIMNNGECLLDITAGNICVLDSLIILIMAIIGLAVYGALLKSALAAIIIFFNNIHNIRQYPENSRAGELKSVVSCPGCSHKSRIPANKKIVFTCPSCKRKFEANNGVIVTTRS